MEKVKEWRLGSLFSGIGGFELGLERAIPGLRTVWQVEQEPFCQSILRKHWSESIIYDDVRTINKNNVAPIDILCGGFPCQDISLAGKGGGINAERSGLWWEYHRIINELQPRIAVMENVPAITIRGLGAVLGSLAEIGYDAEWVTISAAQFGAPHKRDRWFCIAYPSGFACKRRTPTNTHSNRIRTQNPIQSRGETSVVYDRERDATHSSGFRGRETAYRGSVESCDDREQIQQGGQEIQESTNSYSSLSTRGGVSLGAQKRQPRVNSCFRSQSLWENSYIPQPTICRVDDGVPRKLDRASNKIRKHRIKALGNAIVPQCSQWIGEKIWDSGLLF